MKEITYFVKGLLKMTLLVVLCVPLLALGVLSMIAIIGGAEPEETLFARIFNKLTS